MPLLEEYLIFLLRFVYGISVVCIDGKDYVLVIDTRDSLANTILGTSDHFSDVCFLVSISKEMVLLWRV